MKNPQLKKKLTYKNSNPNEIYGYQICVLHLLSVHIICWGQLKSKWNFRRTTTTEIQIQFIAWSSYWNPNKICSVKQLLKSAWNWWRAKVSQLLKSTWNLWRTAESQMKCVAHKWNPNETYSAKLNSTWNVWRTTVPEIHMKSVT